MAALQTGCGDIRRWPAGRCALIARACLVGGLVAAALCLASVPASAEVRFGKNVRIGGHDFSNQTFNAKRRGRIYLYDRQPKNAGCGWRSDGRGGKVKTCHLRRKQDWRQ